MTPHNPLALQIATGWARKRYGNRLSTETLHSIQELLQPPQTITTAPQPDHQQQQTTINNLPTIPEEHYPPLPKPAAPNTLSLYLGPRKSLIEEIKPSHSPRTPTQEAEPHQTSTGTQTTPQQTTNPKTTAVPSPYPIYKKSTSTTPLNPQPRRGPIRPPPPVKKHPEKTIKQPADPTSDPTTSTPKEHRTRKVTWGPLPTKEEQQPPTPRTPLSPILPLTPPATKFFKPTNIIEATAQVHGSPRQPQNPEELQTLTLSTHSNVSVHITDSILTSSPHTDGAAARVGPTGQTATQAEKRPIPVRESANMMKGSNKVTHNLNTTHSEPSPTNSARVALSDMGPPRAAPSPPPHTPKNPLIMDHPSPPQQPSPPASTSSPLQPPISHSCTPNSPSYPLSTSPYSPPLHHSPPPLSTHLCPEMDLDISDSSQEDPPTPADHNSTQPSEITPACLPQPPTEESRTPIIAPSCSPSTTSTITSSGQNFFRPTYHIARPSRKIQDWFFRPRKPVLVLGDSNVNRIPPHNHPQVQLDSYPGANTYHFLKVCEKSIPNPDVKIVVFSIGINNRDQDPRQTTTKQFKTLFRQARLTFPNADIYYPIMNFSSQLTPTQKAPHPSLSPQVGELGPSVSPLPYPNQGLYPVPYPSHHLHPSSTPDPNPFPHPKPNPHPTLYPNPNLNPSPPPHPNPPLSPRPNPNLTSTPCPNPNLPPTPHPLPIPYPNQDLYPPPYPNPKD
ncbi:extensin-like, partial [Seriola dumerili]|uniref:extensin-like n=1 Tax=Seriola dumerili TaxID=41447 RepID=UPI000BBE9F3D